MGLIISQRDKKESTNYEISSKSPDNLIQRHKNESVIETSNKTQAFNLSPDNNTNSLDGVNMEAKPDKQYADSEESKSEENETKKIVKNPVFDSSPIIEDEEFDGIHYMPTPQFIHDKYLNVGQSSRGI